MTELALPFPPLELAHRVGSLEGAADPMEYYDQLGRRTRGEIVQRLPAGWTFVGKRVLDFGCGAGRTLRQFAQDASQSEMWGCDIDAPSIDWMSQHLCPPFHVFVNGPEPPLDQPSSSFDLIWAISVFTHLTDNWSSWMVELHRLLNADGLLYVTFMGSGMSQTIAGEAWDDRNYGMNVLKYGQSWDLGGPMVMHAPWWIEEHWGRAFDVLSLSPAGFASEMSLGHGSVLMRKRDRPVNTRMLEQVELGDAREIDALTHNVKQLHAECADLRRTGDYLNSLMHSGAERERALEAQIEDLSNRLAVLENSRSWNLTRPLRTLAQRARVARH